MEFEPYAIDGAGQPIKRDPDASARDSQGDDFQQAKRLRTDDPSLGFKQDQYGGLAGAQPDQPGPSSAMHAAHEGQGTLAQGLGDAAGLLGPLGTGDGTAGMQPLDQEGSDDEDAPRKKKKGKGDDSDEDYKPPSKNQPATKKKRRVDDGDDDDEATESHGESEGECADRNVDPEVGVKMLLRIRSKVCAGVSTPCACTRSRSPARAHQASHPHPTYSLPSLLLMY